MCFHSKFVNLLDLTQLKKIRILYLFRFSSNESPHLYSGLVSCIYDVDHVCHIFEFLLLWSLRIPHNLIPVVVCSFIFC